MNQFMDELRIVRTTRIDEFII